MSLPIWVRAVLFVGGGMLMLAGADLVPVDPARFHTPHWVVFVAGLAFFSAGVLSLLARHRDERPARYLFAVGILATCLFAVSVAVSIYASGSVIAIGPLLIKGAVADGISRWMYRIGALIVGALALAIWRSWYRALKPSSAEDPGKPRSDLPLP